MKLIDKSENFSENYCARIIKINNIRKHENADRLQVISINGNNIITGMDAKIGDIIIYFPVGSQINKEYLFNNNEFEESQLNKNNTIKSYFRSSGQVRATKLRGEPSQGYIVPCSSLSYMLSDKEIAELETKIDESFDSINDILLVQKYEIKKQKEPGLGNGAKNYREPKLKKLLIPNQLRFHNTTPHLGDNLHHIKPDDEIYISYKMHGSSNIQANVLVKRKLSFIEKILKKFKVEIPVSEYGYIYSSGKPKSGLPKNVKSPSNKEYQNPNGSFYSSDIWERAFNDHKDKLTKGLTIYSELVGFGVNGENIQKGFDYGCKPGEYKQFVYRITYTNIDGNVIEFNWPQIKTFCKTYALETVPELYCGKAKDLFPELSLTEHWHQNFLEKLKDKYLEKNCYLCKNKVPAEGIVIGKVDNSEGFRVFKLKSAAFQILESKELEEGVLDMESAANSE